MDSKKYERLIKLNHEVTDINLKISNLAFYIFTEDFEKRELWEQELMRSQLIHMQEYRDILLERIDNVVC